MVDPVKAPSQFLGKVALAVMFCVVAVNAQTVETLRREVMEKIEMIETEALFNEAELSKKYVAALDVLEAKLTKDGNLDVIVRLREEKESVGKTGEVTAHSDPSLVELREKYLNARTVFRGGVDEARRKEADGVSRKLKDQESGLVKAGKVDEAMALRKEGESLMAEISSGVPAGKEEIFEDPREGVISPLKPITLPQEKPPSVDNPFASNRWLESVTIPAVRQRISNEIWIGNRSKGMWPLVVVPKDTSWAASRGTQRINLTAGNIIATQATFESLNLMADMGSHYYFLNCVLDACGFGKCGTWSGRNQAAKFYFENCLVTKRFNRGSNIVEHGFRAQYSVFEKVEMPTIDYRGKEPVSFLNHPWLKFANCRFVECRIPSSFALLTRECLFENCTFFDDVNFKKVIRPIEVTLYLNGECKWGITTLPENVSIKRKTQADAASFSIPSAASLRQKMGL